MPGTPQPASLSPLSEPGAWPKAELHVHLRGAMPPDYLRRLLGKCRVAEALESLPPRQLALARRNPGVLRLLEAGDPAAEADALFRYGSFEQFLGAYVFTGCLVRSLEDFRGLVAAVRGSFREQNIAYAEVTVSIPDYLQQGMELEGILDALAEDPPDPPRVRWIVDPIRNHGPDAAASLLERILPARPPTLVGLTLGGAERGHPPAPFRRVYEIARAGGLRTTVHAGETLGPESVWDAVRVLEVERVGHGVRAVEDPALLRFLAERGIPLEVCPTSNVRTGVYASLRDHPVRALYEAGVPLAVSTDDPTFFGVSLAQELAGLRQLGFSWEEIGGLAAGAFGFAFDSPAATASILDKRKKDV